MKSYVYVLHFDKPLHHAQHYIGSTTNLPKRLKDHANGNAAALTRHLSVNELEWSLATLYIGTSHHIRRIERLMKQHHNGPKFCAICQNGTPADIEELFECPIPATIKTRSEDYKCP